MAQAGEPRKHKMTACHPLPRCTAAASRVNVCTGLAQSSATRVSRARLAADSRCRVANGAVWSHNHPPRVSDLTHMAVCVLARFS